jgi:hypothetical protein
VVLVVVAMLVMGEYTGGWLATRGDRLRWRASR